MYSMFPRLHFTRRVPNPALTTGFHTMPVVIKDLMHPADAGQLADGVRNVNNPFAFQADRFNDWIWHQIWQVVPNTICISDGVTLRAIGLHNSMQIARFQPGTKVKFTMDAVDPDPHRMAACKLLVCLSKKKCRFSQNGVLMDLEPGDCAVALYSNADRMSVARDNDCTVLVLYVMYTSIPAVRPCALPLDKVLSYREQL